MQNIIFILILAVSSIAIFFLCHKITSQLSKKLRQNCILKEFRIFLLVDIVFVIIVSLCIGFAATMACIFTFIDSDPGGAVAGSAALMLSVFIGLISLVISVFRMVNIYLRYKKKK